MRARQTAALLCIGMILSGCSNGGPGTLDALQDRTKSAGGCRPYDSLDDLLGNTHYRIGDAEPKPLTVAVVTGHFTSVAPGRAFVVAGGDAPDGQVQGFDAEDAVWKTLEGQFLVDHVVSGRAAVGEQLTVGLALGPDIDPDRVDQDLRELGRALLFLTKSPVFAYNPSIYGTESDGSLLTGVADEGTLSLPALNSDRARALLRATPTLASVDAAAAKPTRILVTDPTGCGVLREGSAPT